MKSEIIQSNIEQKINIPEIGASVSINNSPGIYVGTKYEMQCSCCQELNNKNPVVIRYTAKGIEERIVQSFNINKSNNINVALIATGLYQSRIVNKTDDKYNYYEKLLKDAKLI